MRSWFALVLVLVVVALGAYWSRQDSPGPATSPSPTPFFRPPENVCADNLRYLDAYFLKMRMRHSWQLVGIVGAPPGQLQPLLSRVGAPPTIFRCPFDSSNETCSYELVTEAFRKTEADWDFRRPESDPPAYLMDRFRHPDGRRHGLTYRGQLVIFGPDHTQVQSPDLEIARKVLGDEFQFYESR